MSELILLRTKLRLNKMPGGWAIPNVGEYPGDASPKNVACNILGRLHGEGRWR